MEKMMEVHGLIKSYGDVRAGASFSLPFWGMEDAPGSE